MIEATGLTKKYGDKKVVDNLTFRVEEGQILGFLGPNGAGKSTTMNMITGYISATEGTVKVNGYDIYEEPEKAKACIGYLPEMPPLYPDLRVREYLKFVCGLKGVQKENTQSMMDQVMQMTDTEKVEEKLIKHLSKGYKQRVGLAAALVGNPEILILDEPTVGLDPKQILEMRELIRNLSKDHTILLSSHIMQEVSAVCNQILIINEGKLVVSDRPEEIGKHVEQTKELQLLVKGEKEKIEEGLRSIETITRMEIKEGEENGFWQVSLVVPATAEIREDVFYAMADRHCAILEMATKEVTLEEAFISLTQETKPKKYEKSKQEEEEVHESDL